MHFLLIVAPAVGTISMIVGGLTFGWGNWILLLSTSYAVCAIALVPEGLSATVTSILTVVARRLEKKSVYLKVSRRNGIWLKHKLELNQFRTQNLVLK